MSLPGCDLRHLRRSAYPLRFYARRGPTTEWEATVNLVTALLMFLGMGFVMLFLMLMFVKACERV